MTKDADGGALFNTDMEEVDKMEEDTSESKGKIELGVRACAKESGSFKFPGYIILCKMFLNPTKPCQVISCIFRLLFPTVAQNSSLASLLPQFIATLGKKIDLAHQTKESLHTCTRKICHIYVCNVLVAVF